MFAASCSTERRIVMLQNFPVGRTNDRPGQAIAYFGLGLGIGQPMVSNTS